MYLKLGRVIEGARTAFLCCRLRFPGLLFALVVMKKHWHRYQRYKELELIPDQLFQTLKPQLSRLSRSQISRLEISLNLDWPTQRHTQQHTGLTRLKAGLSRLWEAFDLAFLRSLEPRVWQTIDQTGQTCWHLYDPETGKTYHLNSDAEVWGWLQQVFDSSPEAERD